MNFALGLNHMLKLGPTAGKNYCDADGPNGVRNKCSNQVGGDLNDAAGTHDLANYVVADSGGELKDRDSWPDRLGRRFHLRGRSIHHRTPLST